MGEVRPEVLTLMGKSAGWLRFLAVLAFLFSAGTLVIAFAFASLIRDVLPLLGTLGFVLSAILVGIAAVELLCGLKMWAYASAVGRLRAGQLLSDFESAIERQTGLWVTVGAMIGATLLIIAGFGVYLAATGAAPA